MYKIVSVPNSGSFITLEIKSKGGVKCRVRCYVMHAMNSVHSTYCRNSKSCMLQYAIPNIAMNETVIPKI